MIISVKELKDNIDKYLEVVKKEKVLISENGNIIAVLSRPEDEKLSVLNSLVGIAKVDGEISLEEIKDERLSRLK